MTDTRSSHVAALAAAVEADDLDRIAAIVSGGIFTLLQEDWRLLITAIERLPEEQVVANPVLAIVRDFGGAVRLRDGAINHKVVPAFSGDGSALPEVPDRVLDAVLLQEMLAHRFRADYDAAKAVADRLRPRISRGDVHGRRPVHDLVAFVALHIGITETLHGDLEQALRDLSDARILRAEEQHDLSERDALLKTALVHAALGRIVEAERLAGLAATLPEPGESFQGFLAATTSSVEALVAVDRLDPRAPELIAEALERNVDDELWSLALLASTRWAIATGDPHGAIDQIEQAAAFRPLPSGSLPAAIAAAGRAQALAMMGEFGAAAQVLERGGDCGLRDAAVVRVRLALHADGPEAAIAAARRLVVQSGIGPAARAETMLIAAWAQTLLLGSPDPATAAPLGALIAREGLWRTLQLVPDAVAASIPGLDAAPAFPRRLVVPEPGLNVRLTPNELEILRLLAGPHSLPAIAKSRFVTINTVKSQVSSIYRRLGVHGRREAVAEATRRGILDLGG